MSQDAQETVWATTRNNLKRASFFMEAHGAEAALSAVREARQVFELYGYPDWWRLADRVESDAVFFQRSQEVW